MFYFPLVSELHFFFKIDNLHLYYLAGFIIFIIIGLSNGLAPIWYQAIA